MSKKSDKSQVFACRLCRLYKNMEDENGNRITQAKIAEALGVGVDTVNSWCSGSLPSATSLIALADYLECDVDYLLGRIDHVTHENKFVSDKTGLSEEAVKTLCYWYDIGNDERTDALNHFLEFESGEDFEECLLLISKLKKEITTLKEAHLPIMQKMFNELNNENDHILDVEIAIKEKNYRVARSYYFDAVEKFKKSIDGYINDTLGREWYNLEKEINEMKYNLSNKLIEKINKKSTNARK